MKKIILFLCFICLICFATYADIMDGPSWVYGDCTEWEGYQEEYIYGVGQGNMSNDLNSIKMAKLNAKSAIAETVSNAIKAYSQAFSNDAKATSGKDRKVQQQMVERLTTYSESFSNVTLKGVKQVAIWKDKENNTIYIMMAMPASSLEPIVKDGIKTVVEETYQENFVKNGGAEEANRMADDFVKNYLPNIMDYYDAN